MPCKSVSICVCHAQFVKYPLDICFHVEDRLIIILIISIISPSQHVKDKKSDGRAEKANAKLCIIGQKAFNPRKGEYHITGIDQPTSWQTILNRWPYM